MKVFFRVLFNSTPPFSLLVLFNRISLAKNLPAFVFEKIYYSYNIMASLLSHPTIYPGVQ